MIVLLAVLALAQSTAAKPRADPCFESMHEQAARDLHCPLEETHVWPWDGAIDARGCGMRATYRLHPPGDELCSWDTVEPPRIDPEQAKNELRVDLGAGAPNGVIGISYQRRVGGIFSLEPGIGFGVSGTQVSFMVRVRNVPILGAPGIGASLAFGPNVDWLVGEKKNVIVWLDAEIVGLEHRFGSGLALSLGAGIVAPLAGDFSVCHSKCTAVESQSFIYPALRLSAGWWL